MTDSSTGPAYRDSAAHWEKHLPVRRMIFSPVARALLEECQLSLSEGSGLRVLDLACGNGDMAFAAADRFRLNDRVIGTDLVPNVIRRARSLVAGAGLAIVDLCACDAA